jgi:hypothetical protein
MNYFTKGPKAYAIINEEASTVVKALVTDIFCRFRVPQDLHSDYDNNFESRLVQVLQ